MPCLHPPLAPASRRLRLEQGQPYGLAERRLGGRRRAGGQRAAGQSGNKAR
jgi:hypothetical protein